MRFSTIAASLFALVAPAALVSAVPTAPTGNTTATFSDFYDNPGSSLDTVACSNGPNGLETKGHTTFGTLPSFPYIGGTHFVSGWNSPSCGSCWKINYEDNSTLMTAVDTSGSGFALSRAAFQQLTNGQGVAKGTVEVTYEEVDALRCGL